MEKNPVKTTIGEQLNIIFIVVLTSLICFIGIILGFKYMLNDNSIEIYSGIYDKQSEYYKDDIVVEIIANKCQQYNKVVNKIFCVNKYFKMFYVYDKEKAKVENNNITRSPSTMFLKGGVCKDASVFYCAVMKKMNITCRQQLITKHVFNIIDIPEENVYCIVDQKQIYCQRLGENEGEESNGMREMWEGPNKTEFIEYS